MKYRLAFMGRAAARSPGGGEHPRGPAEWRGASAGAAATARWVRATLPGGRQRGAGRAEATAVDFR